MLRVKVKMTYRAVPYELEIEASDKTDIQYLLNEDLGAIMDSIHKFIDAELKKVEPQ